MDFNEMVDHFKEQRASIQDLPVFYPTQLVCFRNDKVIASVAAPKPTSHAVAEILSAIAIVKPDQVVFVVETRVRKEPHSDYPLREDPSATSALLTLGVAREGHIDISIDPFAVDDSGKLTWLLGSWYAPLAPILVKAIEEVYTADVENSSMEFMLWMQVNGYMVNMDPKLMLGEE